MQQLNKNIKVITIKELINAGISQDEILKVCDKLYNMADFSKDYPKHKSWFYKKHLPGTLDNKIERDILFACDKENIYGISFIKYADEKKICTIYVLPKMRGLGIGTLLLEKAMNILGTTKPMITFPEHKMSDFKGIIDKYKWEQTQILEGIYNLENREYVYNGFLEK